MIIHIVDMHIYSRNTIVKADPQNTINMHRSVFKRETAEITIIMIAFDVAILKVTLNVNWTPLILSAVGRLENLFSTYARTWSWTQVFCVESERVTARPPWLRITLILQVRSDCLAAISSVEHLSKNQMNCNIPLRRLIHGRCQASTRCTEYFTAAQLSNKLPRDTFGSTNRIKLKNFYPTRSTTKMICTISKSTSTNPLQFDAIKLSIITKTAK